MDDLGVPLFLEIPICSSNSLSILQASCKLSCNVWNRLNIEICFSWINQIWFWGHEHQLGWLPEFGLQRSILGGYRKTYRFTVDGQYNKYGTFPFRKGPGLCCIAFLLSCWPDRLSSSTLSFADQRLMVNLSDCEKVAVMLFLFFWLCNL